MQRNRASSCLCHLSHSSAVLTSIGEETTGTEKVSQSEPESFTDSQLTPTQYVPKSDNRGLFIEAKGRDVNKMIYGEEEQGSVRGVPGQVGPILHNLTCQTDSGNP